MMGTGTFRRVVAGMLLVAGAAGSMQLLAAPAEASAVVAAADEQIAAAAAIIDESGALATDEGTSTSGRWTVHWRSAGRTAMVAVADGRSCAFGAVIGAQLQDTWLSPDSQACTADRLSDLFAEYAGGAQQVIDTALSRVGDPYVWGGARPGGFDCSGLVQWAFDQHGIGMPRTTFDQVGVGTPVGVLADAKPGDLLFFHTYARYSHVGLYLGEGRMLHAPHRGSSVRVDRLGADYTTPVAAIRRPF